MSEFTKEDAVRVISSRKMVAPSVDGATTTCKVISIGDYTDEEGVQYKIVNLALMNAYHVAQAKKLLAEGIISGKGNATNQHYSQRFRADSAWIPAIKSTVEVLIEEVTTKNGVTGQFITNMNPIASVACGKVDLSMDFEEVEEESIDEVLGKKK